VDFVAVVDQAIALLRQRGRLTYRTLKRKFQLDDEALEDLKVELIEGQRLATDEQDTVLVWAGDAEDAPAPARTPGPPGPAGGAQGSPIAYTPRALSSCWGGIVSPSNSRHFPDAIATDPTLRPPALSP
jgi:hypothetical protein